MATIGFGKYKGIKVEDLRDMKYLKWLAGNNERDAKEGKTDGFKVPADVEAAAKARLAGSENKSEYGSRPPKPLDNFGQLLNSEISEVEMLVGNSTSDDADIFNAGLLEGLMRAKQIYEQSGA